MYYDELYHYGVKGMHWGIRRTPEQLGHLRYAKGNKGGVYKSSDVVFVSGKVKFDNPIPATVKHELDNVMKANSKIIIGDAPGADTRCQDYLAEKNYKNVVVYTTDEQVRNNVGSWTVKKISSNGRSEERDIRAQKDIAMSNAATKGIAISSSDDRPGSAMAKNLQRLNDSEKPIQFYDYKKDLMSDMSRKKQLAHSQDDELYHHGILGQKWGKRNGPPYPLGGGDYTESERRAIYKKRKVKNSIYNKKHFDEVLRADKTTLSTLSYDKDRTKNTDMFYATHDFFDKHQYNALFNKKIPQTIYDEKGHPIGTGQFTKYKINNSIKKDLKVASEDSGAEVFRSLYKKDRDFYNFVTDDQRMQSYFVQDKYKFKGYREARDVIQKMKTDDKYIPTSNDLQKVYRMFNYVIPYDGEGNARKGKDVLTNRTKFFNACKEAGYGAVLDTNDAIYGGFKARSPVIVFDMEQIIPKDIYRTTINSQRVSDVILAARKLGRL